MLFQFLSFLLSCNFFPQWPAFSLFMHTSVVRWPLKQIISIQIIIKLILSYPGGFLVGGSFTCIEKTKYWISVSTKLFFTFISHPKFIFKSRHLNFPTKCMFHIEGNESKWQNRPKPKQSRFKRNGSNEANSVRIYGGNYKGRWLEFSNLKFNFSPKISCESFAFWKFLSPPNRILEIFMFSTLHISASITRIFTSSQMCHIRL